MTADRISAIVSTVTILATVGACVCLGLLLHIAAHVSEVVIYDAKIF